MSMQTDCVYGYGFSVYASDEELKQFILKHKDTVATLDEGRRLLDYMDGCTDDEFNPKEDFFDWQCETSTDDGFYGIIADVMCRETGIMFEYFVAQEDEDDAIIFRETMPWLMSQREKELTKVSMDAILRKYIDDLGGHLQIDSIRLEYFG